MRRGDDMGRERRGGNKGEGRKGKEKGKKRGGEGREAKGEERREGRGPRLELVWSLPEWLIRPCLLRCVTQCCVAIFSLSLRTPRPEGVGFSPPRQLFRSALTSHGMSIIFLAEMEK